MTGRFVIARNECEVSVLDTDNSVTDENLLVFSVDCETVDDAKIIAEELYDLVRTLNGQDKELREQGIHFP